PPCLSPASAPTARGAALAPPPPPPLPSQQKALCLVEALALALGILSSLFLSSLFCVLRLSFEEAAELLGLGVVAGPRVFVRLLPFSQSAGKSNAKSYYQGVVTVKPNTFADF